MKTPRSIQIFSVVLLMLSPLVSLGGTIKATAEPSAGTAAKGQQVTVPVVIDLTSLPKKLGSFTFELRWDPKVLRYVDHSPGSTEGFGASAVNTGKASEGRLVFAAANPRGASGVVDALNVKFKVIGSEGMRSSLQLKFTAMAAAGTYENLLPFLASVRTGVRQEVGVREIPKEFSLSQNSPNPFNPRTEISYQLPRSEHVKLVVYNLMGQRIRTLVDAQAEAGAHTVHWDSKDDLGVDVAAGIYTYEIQAGRFIDVKKMILVR